MRERRIFGDRVYLVEDCGMEPISRHPSNRFPGQLVRCSRVIGLVTPTQEEVASMEAGRRVTAAIRASLRQGEKRE